MTPNGRSSLARRAAGLLNSSFATGASHHFAHGPSSLVTRWREHVAVGSRPAGLEDLPDVLEGERADVLLSSSSASAAERERGRRHVGPVAAGDGRDREERRQLFQARSLSPSGRSTVGGRDRVEVVEREAGELVAAPAAVAAHRLGVERVPLLDRRRLARRATMRIARSSIVSGSRPIAATTFGAQVENSRGSFASPSARTTKAVSRVWPGVEDAAQFVVHLRERVRLVDQERRLPRLDRPEQRGRGDVPAQQRGAAQVARDDDAVLDFPQRFVGEEMSRIGETPKQSKTCE